MRNKFYIGLGFCAIFFGAASAFAQGYDTCAHLKLWEYGMPQDEAHYKLQNDTLRIYIKKCAPFDCSAASAFSPLDGAVQFMSNDSARFDEYRAWLISVLDLNKTCEDYFCSDIGAIETTFAYSKYGPLAHLAVMNYLRQNHPNCWGPGGDKAYANDSATAAHYGYDPNHLPPLDSLGLGFLLKSATALSPNTPPSSQYIASFTSSPNPFKAETKLRFELNRMSYATIEVYDLLGSKVYAGGGRSYEARRYEIALDGRSLPSGTLYARISTGFGEVKTVKLIHE